MLSLNRERLALCFVEAIERVRAHDALCAMFGVEGQEMNRHQMLDLLVECGYPTDAPIVPGTTAILKDCAEKGDPDTVECAVKILWEHFVQSYL